MSGRVHPTVRYAPLYADGHQRPYGGVESGYKDEALRPAERQSEQPTAIENELDDLRHAEHDDQQVGNGQVRDEEVRG